MRKPILIVIVCGVLAVMLIVLEKGTQVEFVEGNHPPAASFTYTITSPENGGPVKFVNGSTDPAGDIIGYLWDFGDGTTSTEQNPTHQYSSGSTYTVTLTVRDTKDDTDSYSENITVRGEDYPNAFFVYSPVSPTVDDIVQFTDKSTDPDGTIVSWSWNFGDDNTSTAQNPTHQYALSIYAPMRFVVRLTVTDDDGHTDTYQTGISVSPG